MNVIEARQQGLCDYYLRYEKAKYTGISDAGPVGEVVDEFKESKKNSGLYRFRYSLSNTYFPSSLALVAILLNTSVGFLKSLRSFHFRIKRQTAFLRHVTGFPCLGLLRKLRHHIEYSDSY